MAHSFELVADPDPDELAFIGNALSAFNEKDVGPSGMIPLAVLVREGATIVAGLSGNTAWGWLYVQKLWVSETRRGQGLAGRMLEEAEAEAIRRGCHGAWIDTFNPLGLHAYAKAGYEPFGALEDFPKGRSRTFLMKRLSP